jgi:molybdenum ABC transporter molybdate-binding protein
MRGAAIPLILTVAIIVALLSLLSESGSGSGSGSTELLVYCAAGIKGPVAEIARAYEDEFGVSIHLQYGGSGTLLSNLEISNQGDLYVAADTSYTDIARGKGLVREAIPLALLEPVIAVPKGNPKNITSVDDLLRDGLRLSLANPDAASVGKTAKKMLGKIGLWERINAAVRQNGVFKPTVSEVANDVKLGTVDAAIVWDVTVNQYDELEAVPIRGSEGFVKHVTIGVLTKSKQSAEALRFARYLAAPEKGAPVFEKNGFPSVPGDSWAKSPEILYYSGGVNRIAIEETLREFQDREGVSITTVYNGCGILLGQIKGGGEPDMYHTCDASFMKGVEAQFGVVHELSKTDIVIIVQKGNPYDVRSLADLGDRKLQLGVCNEEQSTLGTMTAQLLRKYGLYDSVSRNVVVNTPTADLLVTQLTVGKLDAAIVYKANTTYIRDHADVIPLELEGAVATQTISIARQTRYPQLLKRLEDVLRTAKSKDRFLSSGFEWIATGNAE